MTTSPSLHADDDTRGDIDEAVTDDGTPAASAPRRRKTSRRSQLIGLSAVVLCYILWTTLTGHLRLDQTHMFIWILLGLLSVSMHDLRSLGNGIVHDWAPFFLILWGYGWLRGHADNLSSKAHSMTQIHFDEWMLHGHVSSVWLQSHFFHPDSPRWYDYVAVTVYMSHFVVSFLVAGVLWKLDHGKFRAFMTMFVTLTFSAFITFLLYPALPPWLASQRGLLPPTARVIHAAWQYIDARSVSALFSPRSTDSNPVAAVPSLHSAYPMLLLAFFWQAGWRARIPLGLYAVAMALTLLYGGEHYIVDIAFGWTYAILTVWACRRVARPSSPRRARKALPRAARTQGAE